MFDRDLKVCDLKKKKKKNRHIAVGMLAVALAGTTLFSGTSGVAYAAQLSADTLQMDDSLPRGGLMEMVTEEIAGVISDGTQVSNRLRSITPELRQYDWDCYSSDYYYSRLSTKEQQLYERLDAACGELLTSEELNAASYKVRSGSKTLTRRGTKKVSCLGLTNEQVKKVQTLFIYSNPQYYFLNTILFTTDDGVCALGMYDVFADGSSRAQATEQVRERLEELQVQIDEDGSVFETETQIHELLCDELVYMSGDDVLRDKTDPYFSQTIYGALINGETVCAGYTKLYTMLCNAFGIDCIPVSSTDHAWNEVRYGDDWYIVDVTWDDTKDRGKFFHVTDRQMTAMDQNNSHVPYSFYDGIRPVADTEFSEELELMSALAQPQIEIKDTAPGVTITMTSAEGEIFYTLDGTAPGEDDRYTEPVSLTDGGTYIVTAVTAAEGYLPSAYEIFPVRIAGGSVSAAAATNVSGKKIKVTFKTSKSYSGYEISYASKKDFSNQKSAKVKSKTVQISGLKKGRTYYIRVRGYKKDAYGNYYYTPYSKMKKVTVTK